MEELAGQVYVRDGILALLIVGLGFAYWLRERQIREDWKERDASVRQELKDMVGARDIRDEKLRNVITELSNVQRATLDGLDRVERTIDLNRRLEEISNERNSRAP